MTLNKTLLSLICLKFIYEIILYETFFAQSSSEVVFVKKQTDTLNLICN